jgi:protein-tyrosine phosphatase
VVPVLEGFGRVPVPADPWNEIAEGLYQGGSWVTPTEEDFDAVLTLYASSEPVSHLIHHREWHILDAGVPSEDQLAGATRWVRDHWQRGRRVLVRCQAGLNRSGLVVARTLIEAGATPDSAIQLIRLKRSGYALCNRRFEAYLRQLVVDESAAQQGARPADG